MSNPPVPATLMHRCVVDTAGVELGRIVAVIHAARGTDVLVDRRRLWRHTTIRVAGATLRERGDGVLVHEPVSDGPQQTGRGDASAA